MLVRRWKAVFLLVCGVGLLRIASYHLVYEPWRAPGPVRIGAEFEPLLPLIAGAARIGYLSDQPLDEDPTKARASDRADVAYSRAQYVLAPTVLAHADRTLPLLLANFEDPARLDRLIASGEYRLLARPERSIALLQRR